MLSSVPDSFLLWKPKKLAIWEDSMEWSKRQQKNETGVSVEKGGPVKMAHPICLIENTEENKLKTNQEALEILSSITQPVVVVSIVGKYRTGKSYLMNRLAESNSGFPLGSTVQSKTKGIWMWCVPHPCRKGQTLVLLDTEGLGDVEKGDQKNDHWIFALAILLSSTLVYNSIGIIDNEALLSLHFVTEISEFIRVKSSKEDKEKASNEFMRFFPSFVWAVRDFSLELDIDGKKVTPDGYLENSLKLRKVLGTLVLTYVDAIRSGEVPCLENAVDVLAHIENSAAVEISHNLYRNLLDERIVLPTNTQQEVSGVHDECMKEALKLFMERSFKDTDQLYQKALMENIKKEYDRKCKENEELSYKFCNDLLEELWRDIFQEFYMRPGGYTDFRIEVDNIIQKYRDRPGKGTKAEETLQTFMKQKKEMESCILVADKNLTKQEKKLAEEKARAELEKFKAEAAKKKQEILDQRLLDVQKAHKENIQQLEEKMEKERKAMIEENERILERRLVEQKALLEEGFEKEANLLNAAIEDLKNKVTFLKYFFIKHTPPKQDTTKAKDISGFTEKTDEKGCILL